MKLEKYLYVKFVNRKVRIIMNHLTVNGRMLKLEIDKKNIKSTFSKNVYERRKMSRIF